MDAPFAIQDARDAGVPDWRDVAGYPKADELSFAQWRWEFLRRNHKYRHDYFRSEHSFESESKGRYFERAYHILSPGDPRRSVRDILDSYQNELSLFEPPEFDSLFIESTLKYWYSHANEPEDRLMCETEPSHLYLRLDLRYPLGPQLRRLKQIAEDAQKPWTKGRKKIGRPRTRNWPLYLRVLDARDTGASYATIARALLTHHNRTEQAARDVVKQAEALRNDWPNYSQ